MKLKKSKIRLKSKIARYINKTFIDKRFKPLIIDIIMRRAMQYNRSSSELMKDIESVLYNLNDVKVVAPAEMAEFDDALAVYSSYYKKIFISSEVLKNDPEQAYQILAHELHHVMLKDNDGHDKMEKYNEMLGIRSNIYQELLAERASYRLVKSTKNDLTTYNHNANEYEDIVFILDFIEAAYGVNEQELLEHMLNGRAEMGKFLSKKAGEKIEETEIFLDELEVGGSLLMRTLYENVYTNIKEDQTEDFQKDIIAAIDSMFSVCQCKINDRLENAHVQTMEEAKALKEEIAFSQYRLDNILRNRLANFKGDLGEKIQNVWDNCMKKYAESTIGRLGDMDQMLTDSTISTEQLKVSLFNEVRSYYCDDDEFQRRFFTNRKKGGFTVSTAYVESKKESSEYTMGWDNKSIIDLIEKIVKSERMRSYSEDISSYRLSGQQREQYFSSLKKRRAARDATKVDMSSNNQNELQDKE